MNTQELTQKITEAKTLKGQDRIQARNDLVTQRVTEIIAQYRTNLPAGKIVAAFKIEKTLKQLIANIDVAQPNALNGTYADRYVVVEGKEVCLRNLRVKITQFAEEA